MIASVIGPIPEVKFVIPEQLPIAPIPPPEPGAEALGTMTWDLPGTIVYTPGQEITAIIECLNPTSEDKLYAIGYYFLNPQKAIVATDYLSFLADSFQFVAFLLPAYGEIPMTSTLSFSCPEAGYTFGLRMLLVELVDKQAVVIQETNRLEVLLASSYNGTNGFLSGVFEVLALTMLMIPMTMLIKKEA